VSPDDRFQIELLEAHHDRAAFSSGVDALDNYLRQYAWQDARRHLSAVYVLVDPSENRIAGYYTLSAFAIEPREFPLDVSRKLPRRQVPTYLLGRLAVDMDYRQQGFGKRLLVDALQRALEGSRSIAAMAVIVDAKDDTARAFYERYGFRRFTTDPHRLFIMMGTISAITGN
jgi:ribosomal protein S18 acetylase RimI-like enzyme